MLFRDPAFVTLLETIREVVLDGTSKVILNLKDVRYMDSQMLGALFSSYNHVKNLGGKLVLLNLNPKIQKLLDITKLSKVFEIFDDEQKALEGCE